MEWASVSGRIKAYFLDPGIRNPSILPDAEMGRRTNTAWEEKAF
jgi:hypothetical protein